MDRNSVLSALQARSKAVAKVEKVVIGDDTYYVRTMTGASKDSLQEDTGKLESQGKSVYHNLRGRIICRTLCDEGGARLLKDEDAEAVGALDESIVETLYQAAIKLSNLDRSAEDAQKKESGPSGSS